MQDHLLQLEVLDEQWLPHYEELEAGVETSPHVLVTDCAFQQALRRLDAPLSLQIADLPSLSQLEHEFRSVPAGKPLAMTHSHRSYFIEPRPQ